MGLLSSYLQSHFKPIDSASDLHLLISALISFLLPHSSLPVSEIGTPYKVPLTVQVTHFLHDVNVANEATTINDNTIFLIILFL